MGKSYFDKSLHNSLEDEKEEFVFIDQLKGRGEHKALRHTIIVKIYQRRKQSFLNLREIQRSLLNTYKHLKT